jgi:hypothetical protein
VNNWKYVLPVDLTFSESFCKILVESLKSWSQDAERNTVKGINYGWIYGGWCDIFLERLILFKASRLFRINNANNY